MSKWTALFLSILCSTQLNAGAVEFIGSIPVVIASDKLNNPGLHESQTVFVQKIRLSTAAQQVLKERLIFLKTFQSKLC